MHEKQEQRGQERHRGGDEEGRLQRRDVGHGPRGGGQDGRADILRHGEGGEHPPARMRERFAGGRHLLTLKKARDFEVNTYRNLAFNVNDCHENSTCFPHASANVETRGEAVFAAKNAIDGVTAATCHGEWPYASWGINRDPNAALTLDFGRDVTIDRIVIYLRADFPHDNWWKNALLTFSDGSDMELTFTKTGTAQEFTFEPKTIRKLEFSHLIKAETESPFPALTQIEVYGTEAQN